MKNIFSVLIAIAILATACNTHNENHGLEKLGKQRDSLRELQASIAGQIKEIESKIAELDTSVREKGILVSTQQLQPDRFEHFVEIHGIVESDKNVAINAETNGTIKSIKVNKGQKVEKGQVLVVLDSELIQKNIDEVETAYDLANTIFQRQDKLWKQNIGSEIQFLEAKNRKESLELKLKTLKAQKEMSVVKAPFAGIVDDIFPKEGEMASPMAPLLRLVNDEKFSVTADVPENYLNSIKNGTEVLLRFPSINFEMEGKISRIGQLINPNNRTFKVQVNIPNPDNILKPNMLSVLMVKTFGADSAIAVPSGAIQQDLRGIEHVFVVERSASNSRARRVDVKTGLSAKNLTLVTSGLKGNEELIVDGARGLNDNEKIETGK